MADNFNFDGSIFEDNNTPQAEGYSAPESADAGAFGADDSYGDFYAPDTTDQAPGAFEDISDASDDYQSDSPDPEDDGEYDDFESRGIKGFIDNFGGKSRILLIITIVLLLFFLIVLGVSGRNAKKNHKTQLEPVSTLPVIELPSEVPVTVPAETQTVQLSGGAGTYTVDTGDNTLALRPNASTDYDAILRLNSGTVVEVLFVDDFSNEGESWGYIVYDNHAGWVNMAYLTQGSVEVTTAQNSLG